MFSPFRTALAGIALAASGGAALAAPVQPFTAAAFAAAQDAGRPVLVDIHADWCPTCRRQAPTIEAISRDPAFKRLVILKLNFDTQTTEKAALRVRRQRTPIAFNGPRERARAIGITDPAQIRALAAAELK